MWQLYIIRCADNSLYTGITTDIERRFGEHNGNGGTAARYLRGKAPLQLVYTCSIGTRSAALKAEHRVKQLAKRDKERLVTGQCSLVDLRVI